MLFFQGQRSGRGEPMRLLGRIAGQGGFFHDKQGQRCTGARLTPTEIMSESRDAFQ